MITLYIYVIKELMDNQNPIDIKYEPLFKEISYLFCDRYDYILEKLGININYKIRFHNAIKQYQEMQRFHNKFEREFIKKEFIDKWILLNPELKSYSEFIDIDLSLSDVAMDNFMGKSPKYVHLDNMRIYNETFVNQDPNFVIVDDK